jgi:hypothetical protein
MAGALAIVSLAAAASGPRREQAASGNVSATFSYIVTSDGDYMDTFGDLWLEISRAGKPLLDEPVPNDSKSGGSASMQPAYFYYQSHRKSVIVRDVDGDSEPEVVIDLYSGGAHCCTLSRVYRYDAASDAYRSTAHMWGDFPYTFKRLNGDRKLEWVSYDDRFAYQFGSYADSGAPVQIFNDVGGRFQDVTRSFPAAIRVDAARWWKSYLGSRGKTNANTGPVSVRGVLAAWAADEYLLGHGRVVLPTLRSAATQGHLTVAPLEQKVEGTPNQYIARLLAFLHKTGYR